MTEREAQQEIRRLRKGAGASFGSYRLVRVTDDEWGIKFTPKGTKQRPSIYKG